MQPPSFDQLHISLSLTCVQEWHFVLQGQDEFKGGVYHGKITFPSSYPYKPPSILMFTPNGRHAGLGIGNGHWKLCNRASACFGANVRGRPWLSNMFNCIRIMLPLKPILVL